MNHTNANSNAGFGLTHVMGQSGATAREEAAGSPGTLAQAKVAESASLAMGVACAIAGWWMVDRFSSREARTNQTLPVKTKRN